MLAWQAQYSDIRKELKEVKGTSDTLRVKTSMLINFGTFVIICLCSQKELKQKQAECDHARAVEKEGEKLRRRMSTMEG